MKILIALSGLVAGYAFASEKDLGSRKNPLKLSMVPSHDSTKILTNMAPIAQCMEKATGYFFDISVPNNYIVVVESLGSKRVDIAFVNTFGYLLANRRYGAKPMLMAVRNGSTTYQGQIIARTDRKIETIKDLQNKKIAYVDPASTSGYLAVKGLLVKNGVKTAEEVFGGKHDSVVTMVYQGSVDAGATYYNEPVDGKIMDARKLVETQFPDVKEKVKILALSEPLPNDPIVVRKELSDAMVAKIRSGFEGCIKTHQDAFKGINNSDALAPAVDKDYDSVRKIVTDMGMDLESTLSGGKR